MTKTELFRFVSYVPAQNSGCWLWVGQVDAKGYGRFFYANRLGKPHRFAYEYWKQPIPASEESDHLCGNRSCVNPEHLESVAHSENVRRGLSPSGVCYRKILCKRGHVLGAKQENGIRTCVTCNRERARTAYGKDPEKYREMRRQRDAAHRHS